MNNPIKKSASTSLILAVSLYLILPLVLTFLYSVFTQWTDVLPTGFTLKFYRDIFSDTGFLMPLMRSVLISVLPVLICTASVVLAMYVIAAHHPSWDKWLQIFCTVPYALQGVILAISILTLYAGAPGILGNRLVMLTGAYCVVILPYMYRGIKNSLAAVNVKALMDAAQLLGASPFYAYWRIIVPNLKKGITVSVLLSTAIIFGDFVIVNTVGGSYYTTAQVYLYKVMFQSGQKSSAVITVLFAVTLAISWLVNRMSQNEKERN